MYLPAKRQTSFFRKKFFRLSLCPSCSSHGAPPPCPKYGRCPLAFALPPSSSHARLVPHWSMVEILVHYFCLPPAYPTYLGRRRPCPFLSFLPWPLLPSKESGLGKRREGEERDQLLLRSKEEEEEEEGEDDLETAIQPGAFTPPPPPPSSLAAKEGRLLLLLI